MTTQELQISDIPVVSTTNMSIVLDLDQTLIATQYDISSLKDLKILSDPNLLPLRNRIYHIVIEDLGKPGVGTKHDFWGITRPHLTDFLIFCFSYFKIVAVWSAGQRPYVEAIVDHIFKDIRPPHIIFTYDDIETGPRGEIIKPLSKMIESNPVLKKHMSLNTILALDDNPTTYSPNIGNGVLIPPYLPTSNDNVKPNINALARDDPTLLQFKYWLLQPDVVRNSDVNKLDKSTIFTTSLDSYKSNLQPLSGYSLR